MLLSYTLYDEEEILISILGDLTDFYDIKIEDKALLESYFDQVDYRATEYNFMTLYMWGSASLLKYHANKNFLLLFGESDGQLFALQPVCHEDFYESALDYIEGIFIAHNQSILYKAISEKFVLYLEEHHPNKYQFDYNIDQSDYFYDAEKMRSLSGRKLHGKKNHFNAFIKTYGDRYEYRRLGKEDYEDCMLLLDKWSENREELRSLNTERDGIKRIFEHFDQLDNVRIGGIFMDGILEAFTVGDLLNEDTVLVHIEKANSAFRGLYVAISKFFLENEFPDAAYVNREEDMGIEGLRKAKQSYRPIEMIVKYEVRKKA